MKNLIFCTNFPRPRHYKDILQALKAIERHLVHCASCEEVCAQFIACEKPAKFAEAINHKAFDAWKREAPVLDRGHTSSTLFLHFLHPLITKNVVLPINERLAPLFYMECELMAALEERQRKRAQAKRSKGRNGQSTHRRANGHAHHFT